MCLFLGLLLKCGFKRYFIDTEVFLSDFGALFPA